MKQGFELFDLIRASGFEPAAIDQVRHEFETSALVSIDAFVAYRPQYQQLCETAIASVLLPLEKITSLTNVGGRQGNSDWYQLLWGELLAGAAEPSDLANNQVKFVTFNYDRSLEQFLLGAIGSTFGLQRQQAYETLQHFQIKHVYGSLGEFRTDVGYSYGGHAREELLQQIAVARGSIKTVPLIRGGRDDEVADWLADAHRVYVLGFGFDATNCDRIGLRDACVRSPDRVTPRHIYASSFHLTLADEQWCASNALAPGSGGPRWIKGDTYTMLREVRAELK